MTPVIIMTRAVNEELIKRVKSLIKAGISTYLVVDHEPPSIPRFNHRIIWIPDETLEKYHWGTLVSESFKRKHNVNYTSWDRATFWAYTQKFDYAWFIEDDVDWIKVADIKKLLNSYNNSTAGLIASHIPDMEDMNQWLHWNTLKGYFPKHIWKASFNVISRISYKVLAGLHKFASKHHKLIFHETLLPTITHTLGLKIEYISNPTAIIRWRPVFKEENIRDYIEKGYKIFHPVKDYNILRNKG